MYRAVSKEGVNSHHRQTKIRTTVAIAVSILIVGYVSSFVTRGRCESMTAERVAHGPLLQPREMMRRRPRRALRRQQHRAGAVRQ